MIELTDAAAKKMKEILTDTEYNGIRAGVLGGGCSGLQYTLEPAEGPIEGDKLFETNGIQLYVDKKSYLFLAGTTIDFVQDMMTMGFKFINPNAVRTCGCGESFGA